MSISARLAPLVHAAAARARATGAPVLASAVLRIDAVDPLDVVTSTAARACDRMYWSRPSERFAMAGIDAAATLAASGADRFAVTDHAWRALLDHAVVDDGARANTHSDVGPTLLGGFTFDPDGPRSAPWRAFPATSLQLPRLLVTAVDDACWLTASVLVDATGAPDVELADLDTLWSALQSTRTHEPTARGVAPDSHATLSYDDARAPAEWRALVATAVREIRTGAMEKVVLAREVRAHATDDAALDVGAMLRSLRAAHPDCFVFGCWRDGDAFVGASPERLVQLRSGEVRASTLAGSVRRGTTADDDAALAARLLASEKDRGEHEVVRRALCAALDDLCDDVSAPHQPSLLTLANVHHLHTPVRATLRPGGSLLALVARIHPTPAVGGEPRNAALRFIREHERLDRGWYAAPVGWVQRDRGEFAVALRSALVTSRAASLFAGCGIVADSDPDREYAESLLKLRPIKHALAAALASGDDGGDDDDAVEEMVAESAS